MEQAIRAFLQRDLSNRGQVETVVLCGSYAIGKAGAHSDVDLCYIGPFSGFQRENVWDGGTEFQLMMAPWSWYEHVVTEYERKGSNIATITVMLATGQCLLGDTERWRHLQSLAIRSYRDGPNPLSADEIRKIRVRITDLWEDYSDIAEERERLWLAMEIVRQCVEAWFKTRRQWAVKTKYELEQIRTFDAAMATLIEDFLPDPGSGEQLRDICTYVLQPIGGWMKESWKS